MGSVNVGTVAFLHTKLGVASLPPRDTYTDARGYMLR